MCIGGKSGGGPVSLSPVLPLIQVRSGLPARAAADKHQRQDAQAATAGTGSGSLPDRAEGARLGSKFPRNEENEE